MGSDPAGERPDIPESQDSRLGLFIQDARDGDSVEALHLGQGGGQDLGRAQGGHMAAGLGQVAIEPEPVLQRQVHEVTMGCHSQLPSHPLTPSIPGLLQLSAASHLFSLPLPPLAVPE